MPADPVVGAAAVHDVLLGWRRLLQGSSTAGALGAAPAANNMHDTTIERDRPDLAV